MLIEKIESNLFLENTYIVNKETETIIIDPGCDVSEIINLVKKQNLKLTKILCTHGHVDHIMGAKDLQKEFSLPLYIHKADEFLVQHASVSAELFGLPKVESPKINYFLDNNASIDFVEIIYTPGHTQGGVCFKINNLLFTGDTLFMGSIGRTDLPGGDYNLLISSIKDKLFNLPDDTIVYPGHGPSTTIGYEKENNPFLNS